MSVLSVLLFMPTFLPSCAHAFGGIYSLRLYSQGCRRFLPRLSQECPIYRSCIVGSCQRHFPNPEPRTPSCELQEFAGGKAQDRAEMERGITAKRRSVLERVPVLLDTDIGSDIDDAVALAYLLKQPRCELLGITTVTGEPDKRAMLCDAVCRAGGREDVPIHVGTSDPLLVKPRQVAATQAEALTADWPHRTFTRDNTAVAFLRETIRSRPGEITLLPIGPLTNIALLFALDPEIPALLKQVVLMGGRYLGRSAQGSVLEWNILCDPHAAARVFAAPVPALTAVGLDVTEPCRMDAADCRLRFTRAGGALALVAAMAEVWFRHAPAITFHDPLAAALIFEPSLCRTDAAQIEVELVSPHATGQTLHVPNASTKPHQIAVSVDPTAFFDHYFSLVGG